MKDVRLSKRLDEFTTGASACFFKICENRSRLPSTHSTGGYIDDKISGSGIK